MQNIPSLKKPKALLVDVGFTLAVYDGASISRLAGQAGVAVDGRAVDATCEPLQRKMAGETWSFSREANRDDKGVDLYALILELAGVQAPAATIKQAARFVWTRHLETNLWTRLLPGVGQALQKVADAGIPMVVVSNSEGTIDELLTKVGLRHFFSAVFDSTVVGFAKPHRTIFDLALAACDCASREALMVGDSLVADVQGARAVGAEAVLIDPYGIHPDASVPRFAGFSAFVDALLP